MSWIDDLVRQLDNNAPSGFSAEEKPTGRGESGVGSEDWRYGYMPSSTPGLRKPGANYGEDYLTPVLKQYPGISSGAISEMARIPTYTRPLDYRHGGEYQEPSIAQQLMGRTPEISINTKAAPEYKVPFALHEFGHGLAGKPYTYSLESPGEYSPFEKSFNESEGARYLGGIPRFQTMNPSEAYADIPRVTGGRLENIPPELRQYYWWLK